jgi:hypothetical protein
MTKAKAPKAKATWDGKLRYKVRRKWLAGRSAACIAEELGAGEGLGWAGWGRGLPPRAAAPGVLGGGPAVRAAAGRAAEAEPARAGDVGCGERSCPASSRVVGDDVPDDAARRSARGGPANTPEHGDLVRAAAAERAACVGGGGVAGSDGRCCGAARCRAAGNQSMQTSVIERFVRY